MRRTKTISTLLLFFGMHAFSQSSATSVSDNNAQALSQLGNVANSNYGYGRTMRFVNPLKTVDGSVYLYSNWNNMAIVQAKGNRSFSLQNINFNLRRNRFVSKIGKDSIFIFDMQNIENIRIYGKTFRKIDSEMGSRIFEVVFESKEFSILNFHSVKLVEGSVNPMLSRKTDKLVHKETYYVWKNGYTDVFKFRKKEILNLLSTNQEARNALDHYYKANGLSFKSVEDFKQAFSAVADVL